MCARMTRAHSTVCLEAKGVRVNDGEGKRARAKTSNGKGEGNRLKEQRQLARHDHDARDAATRRRGLMRV